MRFILLATLMLLVNAARADQVTSIFDNNQAVRAMKDKRLSESQRDLLASLRANPKNYAARMNLGVSFVQINELEKALKEFQSVDQLATDDIGLRFLARYNIGRVRQEQKKIPEALLAYQSALELKPDSLETKTNIELITQNPSGGGGSGDNQQKQDPKDQGDSGDKPDPNQPPKGGDGKEKKPQSLSKQDVEKILEELKSQEQKIRALEYGSKAKESENGKAW